MGILYLIWSFEHKAWWRPHDEGYTEDMLEAGLYTFDEASDICRAHWFPYNPTITRTLEADEAMIPFTDRITDIVMTTRIVSAVQ